MASTLVDKLLLTFTLNNFVMKFFSSLIGFVLLVSSCQRQGEEIDANGKKAMLASSPPPSYNFVLIDKNTREGIVTEGNQKELRIFYNLGGSKIYTQIPQDSRVRLTDPELRPKWQPFSEDCMRTSNGQFSGYLLENKCLSVNFETGVQDFYLEWMGKTVGKITLQHVIVKETINAGNERNYVKFGSIKFNELTPEFGKTDSCTGVYVLPVTI